jgi:hypothetical protein
MPGYLPRTNGQVEAQFKTLKYMPDFPDRFAARPRSASR